MSERTREREGSRQERQKTEAEDAANGQSGRSRPPVQRKPQTRSRPPQGAPGENGAASQGSGAHIKARFEAGPPTGEPGGGLLDYLRANDGVRGVHLRQLEPGESGRDRMLLNMGPQHPSTHGVLRVVLELDGETVVDLDPDIGFMHRNWEYQAEQRTHTQNINFSDRNDYLAPFHNEQLYVEAVERLLPEVQVPERAQYLRIITMELSRIASHLLWIGTFGLDIGAVTPFLYAWRERERIYDIFERSNGGRLFPAYYRVGGVRNDVPHDFEEEVRAYLHQSLFPAWREFEGLLVENRIFKARTKGVSVLPKEVALARGATGPMLRGSGVDCDLRRDEPYSLYERLPVEVPVFQTGDAYARTLVRMEEILQSARIIEAALDQLPDGPVMAKAPRSIKVDGELYHRVESPRGQIGLYFVARGGDGPYRAKWHSPCFMHLQLLEELARGSPVADMVVHIGTLDIVLCEVDR